MKRSSVNSESDTLRFRIRTDVYVFVYFLNVIIHYRYRVPRLLILHTISDKNINNTNCPFRKGNKYVKIFVNFNRIDTKTFSR